MRVEILLGGALPRFGPEHKTAGAAGGMQSAAMARGPAGGVMETSAARTGVAGGAAVPSAPSAVGTAVKVSCSFEALFGAC